MGLFLICELATMLLHMVAVRRRQHRHLMLWAPTMIVYFTLGCAAMYKALYEVILRPFYWDKTRHGVSRFCGPSAGEINGDGT